MDIATLFAEDVKREADTEREARCQRAREARERALATLEGRIIPMDTTVRRKELADGLVYKTHEMKEAPKPAKPKPFPALDDTYGEPYSIDDGVDAQKMSALWCDYANRGADDSWTRWVELYCHFRHFDLTHHLLPQVVADTRKTTLAYVKEKVTDALTSELAATKDALAKTKTRLDEQAEKFVEHVELARQRYDNQRTMMENEVQSLRQEIGLLRREVDLDRALREMNDEVAAVRASVPEIPAEIASLRSENRIASKEANKRIESLEHDLESTRNMLNKARAENSQSAFLIGQLERKLAAKPPAGGQIEIKGATEILTLPIDAAAAAALAAFADECINHGGVQLLSPFGNA
jgi:hypothetical protein